MRRIILVVTLALLFGTVAQAQKARIFQVKHADVEALAGLLRVFPATINPNTELRTISAVAVDPETLTAIEEAIARFDLAPEPQKNVVLTFYLLMAGREVPAGESLPTDLDDVAEQLKSLFGYGGFLLMDTSVLRVRDGEGVQLTTRRLRRATQHFTIFELPRQWFPPASNPLLSDSVNLGSACACQNAQCGGQTRVKVYRRCNIVTLASTPTSTSARVRRWLSARRASTSRAIT